MGWPKGKPRKAKAPAVPIPPETLNEHVERAVLAIVEQMHEGAQPSQDEIRSILPLLDIPPDWNIGALLNVRNNGAEFLVTLFPEEYDYQKPERTLRFGNSSACQNFISKWYARQHHDPRAV